MFTHQRQFSSSEGTIPEEVYLEMKHASDLLRRLRQIDKSAVLAGGAPRSWFFLMLATDLDFFFYNAEQDLEVSRVRLENLLGVCVTLKDTYKLTAGQGGILGHQYLRCVYECTYMGKSCQFMSLSRRISRITDEFPLNLSRIYYDGDIIIPTNEFLVGVSSKSIVNLDSTKTCREKYLSKYLSYFPEFRYYSTISEFESNVH